MGHFGFSYIGLIYMFLLEIPNILWSRNKPQGYDPSDESKILLVFERSGQTFCAAAVLLFRDTNPHGWKPWIAWLIASAILMAIYECYWIRYFIKPTLENFYRPFLGIPFPGAFLPVAAFLLLGIYGRLIWLIAASVILGVGHIGIHIGHARKLRGDI